MPWQFTSQQPIYVQIVEAIEQRIFSGGYGMGERLPSVRELALEAAVNPNTMQRALSELEERGLVSTQRNSGRTVTGDAEAIAKARGEKAARLAAAYARDMEALGFTPDEATAFLTKKEDTDGDDSDKHGAD
ncbi:MAG: GntR family transcriptional regulator [Clostridia bacterium]|nr:GntR family transcriptional regulator [Clostridia bacterium]